MGRVVDILHESAGPAEQEPRRETEEGLQDGLPQFRRKVELKEGEAARAQAQQELARGHDVVRAAVERAVDFGGTGDEGREDQEPADDAKDASAHDSARSWRAAA